MWRQNLKKLDEIHDSTNGNLTKVGDRLENANREIADLKKMIGLMQGHK